MKPIIYLDPGHSLKDPGAVSGPEIESVHARAVRDILAEKLKTHFTVMLVPDTLDLVATTRWINQTARGLDDGYAFAIHLNSNSGTPGIGAEAWYCGGAPDSKEVAIGRQIAKTILDKYCDITKFENRGVHSDDTARYGRLGFVRDTNCYAGLIELCFINNHDEITKLKNNYQLIAEGLYEGILAAYGIKENKNMQATKADVVEIYEEILLRTEEEVLNDPEAMKYVGQSDTFIRQELMKSTERKEREKDRANLAAAKEFINNL